MKVKNHDILVSIIKYRMKDYLIRILIKIGNILLLIIYYL